jgi:ABC-type sugar transport system substrate-binding protein
VIKGEKVPEVIDTGAKFYTHENMDNKDIAPLLYD